MSAHITASSEQTIRIENEGGGICTIGLLKDSARILELFIPEGERGKGLGSSLLSEVEKHCAALGKSTMVCDFAEDDELSHFFLQNDYDLTSGKSILNVQTDRVINSKGVQKTLAMQFEDVSTEYFEVLLDYELEDLKDLLNHFRFPFEKRDLGRYIESLSAVAYDEDMRPRAVILASDLDGQLMVSLLLGVSAKKPQYILSVCQAFVRALSELKLEKKYPVISMLSVNESVMPLLKRLLDKDVSITEQSKTAHAAKEISGSGEELPTQIDEEITVNCWRYDDGLPIYQTDINDKCFWKDATASKGGR